ncbi:MAG: gliding motility-associated C-terminal domain-containing protein [Bacteroidetes bacterium]|nr:gliding motility-associated C-terminal domain-containing protein [Bacteroidota bacterium]
MSDSFFSKFCFSLIALLISFAGIGFSQEESQSWFLVKNQGQWDAPFLFRAELYGSWFYLEKDGYTLKINQQDGLEELRKLIHQNHYDLDTEFTVNHHALRFKWLNTKGAKSLETDNYSFYYNYFIGNDSRRWKGKVPVVKSVTLNSLYDGIDWRVYAPNFHPKHELIISPHADFSKVAFRIDGADGISLNENGELVIKTSLGEVKESKPLVWQLVEGQKIFIDCKYSINPGDSSIFYSLGNYNPNIELIIDPILVFSTYSGSLGDNFGFTATYDIHGNLYAGGIVDGDDGEYPWTIGAFQTHYGGSTGGQPPINLPCDISISKYAADGKSLLYATYLGGHRNEHPHSLVIDNEDNLIVFGTSNSNDFPVDSFGYDTSFNGGYDLVVLKLSEDGSTLLGGSFLGGVSDDGINNGLLRFNYADDFRGDVYVDSANMVYLATCTSSGDFPITSGVTQTIFGGAIDGVVMKIDSSLRTIQWSTFLGSSGHDAAYSIKVIDSLVFVSGGTSSNGLDVFANGVTQSYQGGIADGFITSYYKDSGILKDFTFFGTNDYDQVYFLDFDSEKNIYFSGQTRGSMVRSQGTYGQNQTGQFIGKINQNLDSIYLVTTFGNRTGANKPDLSPSAFLVDKCDNIYFSGWGADIDLNAGSTKDLPITPNAIQQTTDNNDFYLIVLSRELKNLIYATYFGGSMTQDHVDGGTSRFDKNGVIYQSVCASCPNNFSQSFLSDFPITSDAVFTKNFSRRCSNAAFKIDFQVTYNIDADFDAAPISGCSPLTVDFNNKSIGGKNFLWDFGDGTTDTTQNPSHVFDNEGLYSVKLMITDSFSCNNIDSASITIEVLKGPKPQFEFENSFCELETRFKNTTEDKHAILEWDFGDSSKSFEDNPVHQFPHGGIFKVVLRLENPDNGCIDSLDTTLVFAEYPFTNLQIPNVFTPNNDGLNDCYRVLGISDECEQGKIVIYDRWGLVVYKGNLATECWNGRINNTGEELPTGVYYYLITTERNKKTNIETNGVIHLIR